MRSCRTLSTLPDRRPGGMLSVALSLMHLRQGYGTPPGVTRHRGSMEPGLSSSKTSFAPRPPGPLARSHMGYCGRGSNEREQFRPAFAVDDPVDQVGPEAALEGDYRLLRVGHVIAEPLERKQEARVGPIRIDQVARRARQSEAALGERVPREKLARIFLARRGDVANGRRHCRGRSPCRSLMSATSGISAAICSSGKGR